MKYLFILFILWIVPIEVLSQSIYNPKEKHFSGDRIVKVKYRTRCFIDRRVKNRAIFNDWSYPREQEERKRHPKGGYIILKIKNFNDAYTPTEKFAVYMSNKNNVPFYITYLSPGRRKNNPSRLIVQQNPKIVLPLHDTCSQNYPRTVTVINLTRRLQEKFLITVNNRCGCCKKSNL